MWKWETVVNIYYVKVIMQEKLETSSFSSKEKNTVASYMRWARGQIYVLLFDSVVPSEVLFQQM